MYMYICVYIYIYGPDWWGSVGQASSRKAKGLQFDSQSGHMPGLWVWALVRVHTKGSQSMFLSLSFSLPSLLSKNKYIKLKKNLSSVYTFGFFFFERGLVSCHSALRHMLMCP